MSVAFTWRSDRSIGPLNGSAEAISSQLRSMAAPADRRAPDTTVVPKLALDDTLLIRQSAKVSYSQGGSNRAELTSIRESASYSSPKLTPC